MYVSDNSVLALAKRAALYMRVSPHDQNPQNQIPELRQMAARHGFEVVAEFTDSTSGKKRPDGRASTRC